ncbi:MAG: hypothetical protein IJS05_07765 [Paludibacteraceae bacterium]|nr:hypothetical protein [Paludibacteraceae bacterium]
MAQTNTENKQLSDNETNLIGAGIQATGEIVNTAMQLGTDIATSGASAIIGAVTGAISAIGSIFSGMFSSAQEGATNRTYIINETLKDFFKINDNKNSNLAFVIIAGVILVGLIFIKYKKK